MRQEDVKIGGRYLSRIGETMRRVLVLSRVSARAKHLRSRFLCRDEHCIEWEITAAALRTEEMQEQRNIAAIKQSSWEQLSQDPNNKEVRLGGMDQ
jgi:hypothetical protein